jgi:hypothetical protein
MPDLKSAASLALALALTSMAACRHGNDEQNGSGARTNIDLAVTNFAVAPDATDSEDALTLTGTVENLGTETANPMPGDSFLIYFNLSLDGTIEMNEQGFLQKAITVPIPPGGSLPFSYSAAFGDGDTQSIFGNFCSSIGCLPPETGVIGVKVDGTDAIRELNEGNNFQFVTHEVVGTRVGGAMSACDTGLSGCNLIAADGLDSTTLHLPCVGGGCSNTEVLLPNELHRFVNVSMELVGCTTNVCGWGVTITGETQKPGLPTSKLQQQLTCQSFPPHPPKKVCAFVVEIRDPNY